MSKIGEFLKLRIVLPLAEKVSGTCASYWLHQIEEMSTWSREHVIVWQEDKLRSFIRHAYEHTVYYRKLFDSLEIRPEDIQHIEDLQKLPVLTKDTIRKYYNELIPDDIDSIPHRNDKTGGTSGEPMAFLTDEQVWGYITASKIYSWRKSGYRYGDKFAALGSASLFHKAPSFKRRFYDWIRQEKAMNSMNLSPDLCQLYFEKMRNERIHFIYGYASSVYLMAKYAKDHNLDVSFIKGVFTTSENLTAYYREVIETTFKCRVMDSYGARDAGITAFEVSPGKYPVSYDVIPETVGDFGNDNGGVLITTCFLNNAFPLIRYSFGDCALLDKKNPEFNVPVITAIYGRESDVIRLDNGHVLTAPGYTILMNHFDVTAYRIERVNGHCVLMKIHVDSEKWTDLQERKLKTEMQRFIGNDCEFVLEYVDDFKIKSNGKAGFFFN